MPEPPTNPAGQIGKNSSQTPWEDVLNIFDSTSDSLGSKKMPSRETILGFPWLKWDVWGSTHGSKDPKGWDFVARSSTFSMQYWGVASANYEKFDPAMNTFYGNMRETLASMQGDPNYNPLGQPWTFTRAFDALNGTKILLERHAGDLKGWRDKVGKKGDDFQGTGAGAFREVLDDLMFRNNDLVRQLGTRYSGLNVAHTTTDDVNTKDINEAETGLRWAFNKLQSGYDEWMTKSSAAYPTKLFGTIPNTDCKLAWPGGALQAIWNSDAFKNDLESNKSDWHNGRVTEAYPTSKLIGADARNPAFWEGIMSAARDLWTDHLEATLDVAAKAVLAGLPKGYDVARSLLPQIREPHRLNLHKPPPPPPPGSQGPPPPPPPQGPPKDGPKPPGPKDGPPKVPDLTKDNKNSEDSKDNKDKGLNGGPPPPTPPPGPKPPPAPPKPDDKLKVPTGSTIGPGGVVLGPDKKPLLDQLGRQIVVPPGSRIGPDGNIIGPKGDKLAEKDRLARPEPVKKDESQQSELDKYLKSLRGDGTPSMPTLLGSHSPSVSLSSSESPGLYKGSSVSNSSLGSIGSPGGLGSTGSTGELEAPAPPEKPVTTEGGPSLIKNQQGNGNQQNGMGGVPFYPPTAGGMGGGAGGDQNKGERDRTTWLTEDAETWGTDPKLPPSVLGGRRRGNRAAGRGAGGPRNYGQGGNDGRLAGGATSPNHGHAEGSA